MHGLIQFSQQISAAGYETIVQEGWPGAPCGQVGYHILGLFRV